jgi:hypothetical protein
MLLQIKRRVNISFTGVFFSLCVLYVSLHDLALNSMSVVTYTINRFLLAACQLKVYDEGVFGNKCWSFAIIYIFC